LNNETYASKSENSMKTIFILLFTMTLFACNKEKSNSLNGKWKLINYHNITAETSESEPANISRSVILDFSDNRKKGKMEGHTVTNTVSGEYELFKGNKMKTHRFGGTKVGEPHWGGKFWKAIYSTSSFERKSNKLFIYFNEDTEKMEFEKQE